MTGTRTIRFALACSLFALSAQAQDKPVLAFVVNAASDFWKLTEAGVAKAQAELPDFEMQFRYPAQGTAALQNALMDDLVAAGTDAIMISSVDPKNSIDAFNRIAAQVPLFTTDSRCAAVEPHRLSGLIQHACRQTGGRRDGQGPAGRRQVHGLCRLPRCRQREGTDCGLQGSGRRPQHRTGRCARR